MQVDSDAGGQRCRWTAMRCSRDDDAAEECQLEDKVVMTPRNSDGRMR